MKRNIVTVMFAFMVLLLSSIKAEAYTGGFKYEDGGYIFTNTSMPVDVSKAENGESNIDLSKLKVGESTSRNILHIVEVGDASIDEAAKKAGITKIHHVDSKTTKVFIPLGFIPILVRETKTLVYGE